MREHTEREMAQLVAPISAAALGLAFVVGVLIRLAGQRLRRPFWKVGARLAHGAIAGLGLVAGLYLLTVAQLFSLPGSDRIEGLLIVGMGLMWIAASALGLRWVSRHDIPDATWQQPQRGDRRS
jgi:hypothetical protein